MEGKFPAGIRQKDRIKRIMPSFKKRSQRPYYDEKFCAPRKNIAELIRKTHDIWMGGHFLYQKTFSRLEHLHWKSKSRVVDRYCAGCSVSQQSKDGRLKKITVAIPPEIRNGVGDQKLLIV